MPENLCQQGYSMRRLLKLLNVDYYLLYYTKHTLFLPSLPCSPVHGTIFFGDSLKHSVTTSKIKLVYFRFIGNGIFTVVSDHACCHVPGLRELRSHIINSYLLQSQSSPAMVQPALSHFLFILKQPPPLGRNVIGVVINGG